ncbi:single-stranded DNA-binding protein [Streptococcus sp. 10F2]
MNRIFLIGRLTGTPELQKTPSNRSVTRSKLAVKRRYRDQSGERESDFISIVAWGRLAEYITSYACKGSLIGVEGELRTRRYEKDGQMHYLSEVLCSDFQLLETKEQRLLREQRRKQERFEMVSEEGEELPF